MLFDLKKILNFLSRKEKKNLFLLSLSKFFSGIMDMLGVASIIPFLAVISNKKILNENEYILNIKNYFNFDNNEIIIIFALFSLLFLLANYLTKWIDIWYDSYITHNIWLNLSTRLFNSYLFEEYKFHLTNSTNNLLEKVQVKINYAVIGIIHPFFQIFGKLLSSVLLLSFLIIAEPLITSILFLSIGSAYGFIFLFLKKKMTDYGKQQSEATTNSFKTADQAFKSIKDIKINKSFNFFIKSFYKISSVVADVSVKKILFISSPKIVIDLVSYIIGFTIIIYVVIFRSYELSSIVLLIGLYTLVLQRILPNFQIIFQELSNYKYYRPAYEEIYKDLENINANNETLNQINKDFIINNNITLKDAVYSYPSKKEKKIIDIKNITIPINQFIGITGKSGSGKSTLINLITGLLQLDNGEILIDGKGLNAKSLITDWQPLISYVSQSPFIADETVLHNIAYCVDEDKIDIVKVKKAAEIAEISEFIESLSEKYNTKVGENGIRLSGGQKQRISLARAIYLDKEILILDESTSSLDVVTEKKIIDRVIKMKSNKTIISITHRVHSLRNCNKIFILNEGKIEDEGSFQELQNKSKTFNDLIKKSENL